MKSTKLLLTVLITLALLVPSALAAANHGLNAGDYGLRGVVKTFSEQQLLEENGAWVTVPLRTISYDKNGKALRAIIYRGSGSYSDFGYRYDSLGRMTASGRYSSNGIFVKEVTYNYDINGRLRENHYLRADGSIFLSKKYKYDVTGNLEEEEHSAGGRLILTKKFTADHGNNEHIITTYGADGLLLTTERSKIAADGTSAREWRYYGDLNGYGPRQRTIAAGDNTFSTVCYLPDGSLYKYRICDTREGDISKRTVHRADGSLMSELTFDTAGNIITAFKFSLGDKLEKAEKYSYQYDEKGNWTLRGAFERLGDSEEWKATGEIRRAFTYYQ